MTICSDISTLLTSNTNQIAKTSLVRGSLIRVFILANKINIELLYFVVYYISSFAWTTKSRNVETPRIIIVSGAPEFMPGFKWGSCYSIFCFICIFCRSLFVLIYFFFGPLCCLFFFDIRFLITSLVSSNSSFTVLWFQGFSINSIHTTVVKLVSEFGLSTGKTCVDAEPSLKV